MLSKIVLSCSLVLGLIAVAMAAGDYVSLKKQFDAASPELQKQLIEDFHDQADPELRQEIVRALAADRFDKEKPTLQAMIDFRAKTQAQVVSAPNTDVGPKVKQIKASPLYRDTGNRADSNWLGRVFARLGEAISKFFDSIFKPRNAPAGGPPLDIGFPTRLFLYAICGLLAALIGVFIFFVVRHVNWQKTLKRKATALLDEDEPDRSVDEWLGLADALTRQGRYREAVRCLYLAMLLRFDEANVARFVRSQTNWEHLARIQASANRPPEIDFLQPTQAFDKIWYGQRVRGSEDVDQFRIWYGQASKSLMGAKA